MRSTSSLRFFSDGTALLLLSFASLTSVSSAQDAVANAMPVPTMPAGKGIGATGPVGYQWGPFAFSPFASYRFDSIERVRADPGVTVESDRQRVTVGLDAVMGQHWNGSYAVSWNEYSNERFSGRTDHSLSLTGRTSYDAWSFGLDYGYDKSSSILLETARQTSQETHNGSLQVSRTLSERVSGYITVSRNSRTVDNGVDVRSWTVSPGARYFFAPQLIGFADVNLTRSKIQGSPDMESVRPQIGARWDVSDRVSASAFAGWEHREFVSVPNSDTDTPVYGLSLVHRPFQYTVVSVSFEQTTGISYFNARTTETRGWSVGLNQRLLQHLDFSAGITFTDVEYRSTLAGLALARRDEREAWFLRLSTRFLGRFSAALSYRNSENTTDATGFDQNTRQWGVELNYHY